MKFLHTKLANGLEIVGELNESALSMACCYLVKTGACDETPEISGVSHFLEHMAFKGTGRRSAEDINFEFNELGGRKSAGASLENTTYKGRVLPECQTRLIDLLTDMMRPALRNEDFDIEKKVILEEIAKGKDEPVHFAYWTAQELFANGHPLGNRILGTTESISALERGQMISYFERQYSPGNMTVALTGAFDWDAAVRQIDELTRDWEPFDVERETPKIEFGSGTKVVQNEQFSREYLAWRWPGFVLNDERRYAADILADVLTSSAGSCLYWELMEPGIVNAALMQHSAEDQYGAFEACVICSPERAGEVVQKVQDILKDVVENGVSEDDIESVKQEYVLGIALSCETPMGRLEALATRWTYLGEYIDADESIDRILAVTKEDVEALLTEDLFAKGALAAVGPLETLDV